jgi:putative sterol carrier protein
MSSLSIMMNLHEKHKSDLSFKLALQHKKTGLYVTGRGMAIYQRDAYEFEVDADGGTFDEIKKGFYGAHGQTTNSWLEKFTEEEFEIISFVA